MPAPPRMKRQRIEVSAYPALHGGSVYHAWIGDSPECSVKGDSPHDAIGRLIARYPLAFGIDAINKRYNTRMGDESDPTAIEEPTNPELYWKA